MGTQRLNGPRRTGPFVLPWRQPLKGSIRHSDTRAPQARLRIRNHGPWPPRAHSCGKHVFVTAHGSPATRFGRAIERPILINAELAAREMTQVSLEHALALVVLYAEQGEPRFERAALRWLGRLFLEQPMPFSLAARCVELVGELRGPAPEPPAKALTSSSETDARLTSRLRKNRTRFLSSGHLL